MIVTPAVSSIQSEDLTITCPSWCTSDKPHGLHDARLVMGEEDSVRVVVVHRGPSFGPFTMSGETRVDGTDAACAFKFDDEAARMDLIFGADPDALIKLADQATRAANWIAAHEGTANAN